MNESASAGSKVETAIAGALAGNSDGEATTDPIMVNRALGSIRSVWQRFEIDR